LWFLSDQSCQSCFVIQLFVSKRVLAWCHSQAPLKDCPYMFQDVLERTSILHSLKTSIIPLLLHWISFEFHQWMEAKALHQNLATETSHGSGENTIFCLLTSLSQKYYWLIWADYTCKPLSCSSTSFEQVLKVHWTANMPQNCPHLVLVYK
jgi:hypothetical protein